MPVFFAPFFVAPLAGAWIEMLFLPELRRRKRSLPSRERGLKLLKIYVCNVQAFVAPLAGAWIEIKYYNHGVGGRRCRSPRGSVD